jgi:hypothetical protein
MIPIEAQNSIAAIIVSDKNSWLGAYTVRCDKQHIDNELEHYKRIYPHDNVRVKWIQPLE